MYVQMCSDNFAVDGPDHNTNFHLFTELQSWQRVEGTDLLVLHVGTNNLSKGTTNGLATVVINEMKSLLNVAMAKCACPILVSAVLPRNDWYVVCKLTKLMSPCRN